MIDTDQTQKSTPLLPFPPGDLDRYRLRMTRADFARLVGVSKQAVGDWCRKGWVVLGPDGLLDPKDSMRRLLRYIDPARLRAKAMAPLVVEAGTQARRIVQLERELAAAREDAEFHRGASEDLVGEFNALVRRLVGEWPMLMALSADDALATLLAWVAAVNDAGGDPGPLADFVPAISANSAACAPPAEEEEAEVATDTLRVFDESAGAE